MIRLEVIKVDALIVRRNPRRLRAWWKTKKEEPDKTRSYPSKQGQNTKKKEMTHIKEKKEEREERRRIYKKRAKKSLNVWEKYPCNIIYKPK